MENWTGPADGRGVIIPRNRPMRSWMDLLITVSTRHHWPPMQPRDYPAEAGEIARGYFRREYSRPPSERFDEFTLRAGTDPSLIRSARRTAARA